MVKFCAEYGIAHAVTGKLIVATDRSELPRLHALVQRGRENGIPVRELGAAQIPEYEPEVRGLAAIHVGTTRDLRLRRRGPAAGPGLWRGDPLLAPGAAHRPAPGPRSRRAHPLRGGDPRPGPGQLRRTALRRDRPHDRRRPRHADRPLPGRVPRAWRGPSWCGGWSIRCRTRRSRSSRVHLTRGIDGSVHVGPNAVPALAREGYGWGVVRPRELGATLTWPGSWRDSPAALEVRGGRASAVAVQDGVHHGRTQAAPRGDGGGPGGGARRSAGGRRSWRTARWWTTS